VRQGDPLSPLLFVLAANMLQSIINKAKSEGILQLPINVGYIQDFPIIQYADDTLLIMEVYPRQLLALKALINTFASSTGLKVNYTKLHQISHGSNQHFSRKTSSSCIHFPMSGGISTLHLSRFTFMYFSVICSGLLAMFKG
jgi:hypothetical protein